MTDQVKLLLIGSITYSKAKYGEDDVRERFGGGVMYGGKTAAALGIEVAVITVGAEDIEGGMDELRELGLNVKRIPRETSNNFSNDYSGKVRKVYLRSVIGAPLTAEELPDELQDFNCVILFPLFKELSPDIFNKFSDSQLKFLDPTGFLRKTEEPNEEGLYPVLPSDWENLHEFTGKVDILKLSDEDIANIKFPEGVNSDEEKTNYLHQQGFPLVVLTRAEKPTLVVGDGLTLTEVPTLKVEKVVDSAGAGEVFAVAFMYKYFLTRDAVESVKFGNVCAALKISGKDYSLKSVEANIN